MDQIWAIFNSIYNTSKIPIGILKEFLLTRNDNLSTDVVSTELLCGDIALKTIEFVHMKRLFK